MASWRLSKEIDDEIIRRYNEALKNRPPPAVLQEEEPAERPDRGNSFLQAAQNFLYESAAGGGRMLEDLGAEDVGGAIRGFGERGVERNPLVGDLLGGLTDEGDVFGQGSTGTGVSELLGQMAPLLGAGWAGAKVGGMAGAAAGGVGALPGAIAGGILGTMLGMMPTAYEEQAGRQEDERGGAFTPDAGDIAKRYGAAVGSGLIESIGGPQRVLYSGILRSLARRGVGKIDDKLIGKIIADTRPDDMGRWTYRGKHAFNSAITEAVEENLQAVTQMGFAGQDMLSDQALEDYKYGTVGGLIGGGLMGGALVNTRPQSEVADNYYGRAGEPGNRRLPPPPEGAPTIPPTPENKQVLREAVKSGAIPAGTPDYQAALRTLAQGSYNLVDEKVPQYQKATPVDTPKAGPHTKLDEFAAVVKAANEKQAQAVAAQLKDSDLKKQMEEQWADVADENEEANTLFNEYEKLMQQTKFAEAHALLEEAVSKFNLKVKKQEKANADAESSTTTETVGNQPETGEGVREENAEGQKAAQEGEEEKTSDKAWMKYFQGLEALVPDLKTPVPTAVEFDKDKSTELAQTFLKDYAVKKKNTPGAARDIESAEKAIEMYSDDSVSDVVKQQISNYMDNMVGQYADGVVPQQSSNKKVKPYSPYKLDLPEEGATQTKRRKYLNELLQNTEGAADVKIAHQQALKEYPYTDAEQAVLDVLSDDEIALRDDGYMKAVEDIAEAIEVLEGVTKAEAEEAARWEQKGAPKTKTTAEMSPDEKKALALQKQATRRKWTIANALDTLASASSSSQEAVAGAKEKYAQDMPVGLANLARGNLRRLGFEAEGDAVTKERKKMRVTSKADDEKAAAEKQKKAEEKKQERAEAKKAKAEEERVRGIAALKENIASIKQDMAKVKKGSEEYDRLDVNLVAAKESLKALESKGKQKKLNKLDQSSTGALNPEYKRRLEESYPDALDTEQAIELNKTNLNEALAAVQRSRLPKAVKEEVSNLLRERNANRKGTGITSKKYSERAEQAAEKYTVKHGLLPSKSTEETGTTIKSVRQALKDAFGKFNDKNLHIGRGKAGVASVLAEKRGISQEEAEELIPSGAFYDELTGDIYIDASKVPAENAAGVFLHETVHDKLRSDPDIAPLYQELVNRGQALINGPSEIAKRARARVENANTNNPEEKLAYLIEEAQKDYTNTPPSIRRWLNDLLSKVKLWLRDLGILTNTDNLSLNDLRVMFSDSTRKYTLPKRMGTGKTAANNILASMDDIESSGGAQIKRNMNEQAEKNRGGYEYSSTGTVLSDLFMLLPKPINSAIMEALHTAWRKFDDRVITPLHIAAEKNPFGMMVKSLAKAKDDVTQSNLKFQSKFFEDLRKRGYTEQQIKKIAEVTRGISENHLMYNWLDKDGFEQMKEDYKKEIIPLISEIAESVGDEKAMINTLEDDSSEAAKQINAYIDEKFNEAFARQDQFQSGKVKVISVLEDEDSNERKITETRTPVTFDMDPKEMEKLARQIHKTISRTAIAVAISRYAKFNEVKLTHLQGLANMMNLPHGVSGQGAMARLRKGFSTMVKEYGTLLEQDNNKSTKLLKDTVKYADMTGTEKERFALDNFTVEYKQAVDDILSGRTEEERAIFKAEIQERITKVHMAGADAENYYTRAYDTIANFYIPHQRLRPYLATVQYYRADGEKAGTRVRLDEDKYPSMVMDFHTKAEAREFVKNFNSDLEGQEFDVKRTRHFKQDKEELRVYMKATFTERNYKDYVPKAQADLDFDGISRIFDNANVKLSSEQTANLVKHLFVSTKKKRMAPYKAAIGFPYEDSLQSIADYLNGASYIISSNYFDHRIDEILQYDNWRAGRIKARIATLKDRMPYAEGTLLKEQEQELAMLERYAEIAETNDERSGDIQDLMREAIYSRRADASREQDSFDKFSRWAMRNTTIATLGLNLSTAFTQVLTLPIVVPAYFASEYGWLNSEYRLFANTMFLLKSGIFTSVRNTPADAIQSNLAKLKKKDPSRKAFWDQVALEMKEGRLQIGQVLAVTGTAHEGIKLGNQKLRNIADAMMQPFALSEALVRTATFMTAYDLEVAKQRKNSKGKFALSKEAFDKAIEVGNKAVELTQGEYADWARAPALQNKYVRPFTMFWHYPQVQVALIRNMIKGGDIKGASAYLATMYLVAGADGFPFSDILKNIIDILAQEFPQIFGKFGTKAFDGNVRAFLRDEMLGPLEEELSNLTGVDMTEALNKGLASAVTGVDLSFKMGLGSPFGNLGGHNVTDLLGPVGSVGKLAFDSGVEAKNMVMAMATGRDPDPSFKKMMLKMPVSALRNAYKGMIINEGGYYPTREGLAVTESPLTAVDAFVQLLGWMPLEAGSEYSQADVQQRYLNLQREMTADVNALAGQYLRDKDYEGYRDLRRHVLERNRLYRSIGSPLTVNWTPSQHRKRAQTGAMAVTGRTAEKMPKNLQRYARKQYGY